MIDNMQPNGSLSRSNSTSTNIVQNEQIEADVEQLMDLMKTRKQQLESLLNEKNERFWFNMCTRKSSHRHNIR
jgi:hypothetical protein